MIAKITGSDVIRSAGIITSRGKHQSFAHHEVRSLQVPAQRDGRNPEIGKPTSTRDGVEIGDAGIFGRNICIQRASCGRKYKIHAYVSVQNVEVRYVIEEIFNRPDVIVARDGDSTATRAIECAGTIVNRDVDVAKPRGRQNPRIEPNLTGHPLWLLLAVQSCNTAQQKEHQKRNWEANLSGHGALALLIRWNGIQHLGT